MTPPSTSNFRSLGGRDRRARRDETSIAIWTTTPWTLPANLAIAVDAKENYVVQEFEVAHASGLRDPRNRGRSHYFDPG